MTAQIPKILHQTWKDAAPHPALRACLESFRFLNPGWQIRYYTDENCLAWIDQHCPELKDAYQGLPTGIHRADLFRILVLYYEGGIYADIDIECLRPLDELMEALQPDLDRGRSVFLTRDHPAHERIHFKGRAMYMNDFMIAAPGDGLMKEIVKAMLRTRPASQRPNNAVLETGPGVVTTVIDMLGGVDAIPTLGLMPAAWVHPLPDMNCRFEEASFYRAWIQSREWRKQGAFVVHYWFHTWLGTTNMLVEFSHVLLGTPGEMIEAKLQWHLRDSTDEVDYVIACAITEFADMRGSVVISVNEEKSDLADRFLRLLEMSGLRPRLLAHVPGSTEGLAARLESYKSQGIEVLTPANRARPLTAWSNRVLLVCDPGADLQKADLQSLLPGGHGLLLGPRVEWAKTISTARGTPVSLSEARIRAQAVPRTVHLLPGHVNDVPELAEMLSLVELNIRRWQSREVEKLVSDATMGMCDLSLVSEAERQLLAVLSVLSVHGGIAFEGECGAAFRDFAVDPRPMFSETETGWLFACPPESDLLASVLSHWWAEGRKNGSGELQVFLRARLKALLALGRLEGFYGRQGDAASRFV